MAYFVEWFLGFQLLQELLWFALLVIVFVTVTSTRNEPDPGGRRLVACFLAVVMAFSLVVAVFASSIAVSELASLVKDEQHGIEGDYEEELESGGFMDDGEEPGHEDDYAGALQAGLFAVAAGAVFVYHRRKLDHLLADADVRAGAAGRIAEGYGYVATFLGLAALAGGAAAAVFGVVKLAAPDVFSTDDSEAARQAAAGTMLVGAWVAAVGYGIVTLHRHEEGHDALDDLPGPPAEEAPIP